MKTLMHALFIASDRDLLSSTKNREETSDEFPNFGSFTLVEIARIFACTLKLTATVVKIF